MKSPAFQFYPNDFLGGVVATYSLEEIGLYMSLLAFDWNLNGLPTDLEKLAKMSRVSARKFRSLWATVGENFVERDERYFNPRLALERVKQAANREKKQAAAASRWNADAHADALQVECPPSPTPSPSPVIQRTTGADAPPPSRRRSAVVEPTETELAVVECWADHVGETSVVLVRRHLGKAIARHGKPAILSAIADYATAKKAAEKPVKLEWFAAEVAIWVPKRATNDDGTPNELGLAVMLGGARR